MPTVTVSRSVRVADLASQVASFLDRHGVPDERWRADSACNGVDPELFFPRKGEPADAAISVCGECPVRIDCLTWALCHGEKSGIWGGTAERTRRLVRRVVRMSLHDIAA